MANGNVYTLAQRFWLWFTSILKFKCFIYVLHTSEKKVIAFSYIDQNLEQTKKIKTF